MSFSSREPKAFAILSWFVWRCYIRRISSTIGRTAIEQFVLYSCGLCCVHIHVGYQWKLHLFPAVPISPEHALSFLASCWWGLLAMRARSGSYTSWGQFAKCLHHPLPSMLRAFVSLGARMKRALTRAHWAYVCCILRIVLCF